jgi:uncharacterized protein (DUF427 family)
MGALYCLPVWSPEEAMPAESPAHSVVTEPCAKRVRVLFEGQVLADTTHALLMLETRHRPVYYFPRSDVRMELLERTRHSSHCPYKGDASYWSVRSGERIAENAVWSYETPIAGVAEITGRLAFYWDRVDRWLEEDEEIFGHARDPHHRVDVIPSAREVRVVFGGETVARTRKALFLFETGFPTRYYIPPADVRTDLLQPSEQRTICPYKGRASYWSLKVGDKSAPDAVWGYRETLPECPRIKDHVCFYPEKVDRIEVASP